MFVLPCEKKKESRDSSSNYRGGSNHYSCLLCNVVNMVQGKLHIPSISGNSKGEIAIPFPAFFGAVLSEIELCRYRYIRIIV